MIDPIFLQSLIELAVVLIVTLLPVSILIKVGLLITLSVLNYFFILRRGRMENLAYLRRLATQKDKIINAQAVILDETRQNYEEMQKKLKKAHMVLELRELKDRHKDV